MNRSIAQAIVDDLEVEGLFLSDQLGNELYFSTNTGEVDEEYLDVAYNIASEYEAVNVYEAYHQSQDMVVVEILS